MVRTLSRRAVIAALFMAVVGLASVSEAAKGRGRGGSGGGNEPRPAKVEGRVTAVTANSVTITTRRGAVTVTVNAATKVERNDRHVRLTSIRVGDRGEALYNAKTFIALKVESVGPA